MSEVTEQELVQRSKAPRVTLQELNDNIVSEHYFTAYDGMMGAINAGTYDGREPGDMDHTALKLLTICVLTLANGFTVHGVSACASPENFLPDVGKRIAKENAVQQIWPLMGYELRSKLMG